MAAECGPLDSPLNSGIPLVAGLVEGLMGSSSSFPVLIGETPTIP